MYLLLFAGILHGRFIVSMNEQSALNAESICGPSTCKYGSAAHAFTTDQLQDLRYYSLLTPLIFAIFYRTRQI